MQTQASVLVFWGGIFGDFMSLDFDDQGITPPSRTVMDGMSHRALTYLISLSRYSKRAVLMALDFTLLSLALWSAYSLRLGVFYTPDTLSLWALLLTAPIIGVFCFHYNGVYKLITRYSGSQGAMKVAISMAMSVLVWCLIIYMTSYTLSNVPRSVIVIYGLLSTLLVWSARTFISYLLVSYIPLSARGRAEGATPVLIYGVGDTGMQLASELDHGKSHRLVGYLDDNPSVWRQMLSGVRVYNPALIEDIIIRENVSEIFLVDQELTRRRKRELLNSLAPYSVSLKTLSPLQERSSGRVMLSDLREVGLEDLLGRAPVPPQPELLNKNIRGKTVMITGAGGSIGSELARQVAALEPAQLILYERSELALYKIDYELVTFRKSLIAREKACPKAAFKLVSVLGSVCDENLLTKTLAEYGVETVYHAAAYKHVPIVEENPVAGLENNVFGTLTAAKAARAANVELFVLISTDKAVRPTNVMGASKRTAELCLQALAEDVNDGTIFTMVRFGNVLGSSGSVVARFQEQIANGGPITVTHPDIVRYFMMIPEAAQLVIQAGGLASGGEVFVLDMGRPVKIVDLARSMVNLSGLEIADETNLDGDISIEFVGLREGEKLYEELLINKNSSQTLHPKIIRNNEGFLPLAQLEERLLEMKAALEQFNKPKITALLHELVEGYTPETHQNGADDAPIASAENCLASVTSFGEKSSELKDDKPAHSREASALEATETALDEGAATSTFTVSTRH